MVNNKLKACVVFTAVLLVLYGTKSVNGYRDPRQRYGGGSAGVDPAGYGGYRLEPTQEEMSLRQEVKATFGGTMHGY